MSLQHLLHTSITLHDRSTSGASLDPIEQAVKTPVSLSLYHCPYLPQHLLHTLYDLAQGKGPMVVAALQLLTSLLTGNSFVKNLARQVRLISQGTGYCRVYGQARDAGYVRV